MKNTLNKFTTGNGTLSWRAIVPMIGNGFSVRKIDEKKKINVIDYDATEKLIDKLVDTKKIEITQLLKYYQKLLKDVQKIDSKEILNGNFDSYPALRDLRKLREGDYSLFNPTGEIVKIDGLSITVDDSSEKPQRLTPIRKSFTSYDIYQRGIQRRWFKTSYNQ